MYVTYICAYSETCLKRPLKGVGKKQSLKTGGLLTQMNYSEKCTFGSLQWCSLNTGGLLTEVVLRTGLTVLDKAVSL